ncbi:phage portal protein [Anatilimnocola floriformis]|uniref:phage portal protein n=1 Tax=Anatilimnocola floriformis TaxID=2948575 RepID=UPI0020C2728F|nr:phage portal protein [Anatilimnocola floriformis]
MHAAANPNLSFTTFASAGIDTVGSGYDAVKQTGRRRTGDGMLRSEDDTLRQSDRKRLLSSSQQIYRNFTVARWMIARHLDYVSTFHFQAKTGNRALNNKLESLVANWSKAGEFEVSGRFSRSKFTRMGELQRVLNGDFGVLRLRNGKVQGIEGERVRSPNGGLPSGYTLEDFIHGVRTNDWGAHLEYCVCRRGKFSDAGGGTSQFQFERMVPARNMFWFGNYDRFDQTRGIGSITSAINGLADVYESFDYALAREKIAQLFAAVIKVSKDDHPLTQTAAPAEGQADDGQPKYGRINWNGPVQLNLDGDDSLEFVTSDNPSANAQAFWTQMIVLALKALDIPYSFFDESFTTYSGARQALLQYEDSAKIKRQDLQALLSAMLRWRCVLWMLDGSLPGVCLEDVLDRWLWVPNGTPWIDPLKEVTADISAIGAGLTSRQRVCREKYGVDFFEVARELVRETKFLERFGLSTNLSAANVQINEVAA